MSRFHVEIPLRWADLDVYRHVNHARTVTLLEEARVELVFRRAQRDGAGAWSEGLLVASLRVDYKHQIAYRGQSVRVSMWTHGVRAASFMIDYELHTGPAEEDPVAVTASTKMVPYDLVAGRPRRLTEAERAFLDQFADAPAVSPSGAELGARPDAPASPAVSPSDAGLGARAG